MNVDDNKGWGNITLSNGLTTDIVISGSNTIHMTPADSQGWAVTSGGGIITIASDSKDLTIGSNVVVDGELVMNVGAGRTLTANGAVNLWSGIGPTASLNKQGAGTAVLTGANGYNGTTTVTEGSLKLQGGAFSTTARAYAIASGAVLNVDGPTGIASGTTTLSGDGTLRISGGTLSSGADGRDLTMAMGSGALIEIQSGASIVNGGWQNMTWTNNLADMQVDGTLDLNDGNPVIIDALTGSGTINHTNWTDQWVDSRTLTVGKNDGSGTFSGVITQASVHVTGLTKNGGGTQILTGANDYKGATTINGGTLQIGDGGLTGTLGSGAVTIESGAFLTINRSDNYGTTYNQSFSGAGTLVKEGAGDLVINGDYNANYAVQNLQNLTINNGLVRTDNNGTWKSDLNLTANGSGKFELWNTNTSLGSLNGNGTVQNTTYWGNGTTVLTVAAGSFTGTITDSGITSGGSGTGDTRLSLVKSTTGTLSLSGTLSYGGSTSVESGTLAVVGSLPAASTGDSGKRRYPQPRHGRGHRHPECGNHNHRRHTGHRP